jgi:hypothetical protein
MPDYSQDPQNISSLTTFNHIVTNDDINNITRTATYKTGQTNVSLSTLSGNCPIADHSFVTVPVSNRGSTFVVVTSSTTTYSQADLAKSLTGEG